MLRLLLDANLSQTITAAVRRHRPTCPITDLHEWEGGRYLRERDDDAILEAAWLQGLTLVIRDIDSIAPLIVRRRLEGRPFAGVLFLHPRRFPEGNVGAVVRALIQIWERGHDMDLQDREVFLDPV